MPTGEIQTRSTLLAEVVGELERAGGGVVGDDHDVGLGRVR